MAVLWAGLLPETDGNNFIVIPVMQLNSLSPSRRPSFSQGL